MDRNSHQTYNLTTGIVYLGNRDPYHYISDIEEILTHHCNFIVHIITEEDLEYYRKTLAELFEISKEAGFTVIAQPWGIGNVLDGFTPSKFVLEHQESLQMLSNFQSVPAACMNNPNFRNYLKQWIDAVVELGVDGIAWENPHYYTLKNEKKMLQWGCWCNNCKELYLKKFHHRLPTGIGEEIILLNEYSIINFLLEMCNYAKEKHLINIVCLSPIYYRNLSMSSWHQISEIQTVDILAAKPYWYYSQFQADSFVKGIAKKISGLCEKNGKISQIWIQNFKLLSGEESQVKKVIEICIEENIESLVGWNYYGSRVISSMRCQNPKAVWDILGEMFGRFILHRNSIKKQNIISSENSTYNV